MEVEQVGLMWGVRTWMPGGFENLERRFPFTKMGKMEREVWGGEFSCGHKFEGVVFSGTNTVEYRVYLLNRYLLGLVTMDIGDWHAAHSYFQFSSVDPLKKQTQTHP